MKSKEEYSAPSVPLQYRCCLPCGGSSSSSSQKYALHLRGRVQADGRALCCLNKHTLKVRCGEHDGSNKGAQRTFFLTHALHRSSPHYCCVSPGGCLRRVRAGRLVVQRLLRAWRRRGPLLVRRLLVRPVRGVRRRRGGGGAAACTVGGDRHRCEGRDAALRGETNPTLVRDTHVSYIMYIPKQMFCHVSFWYFFIELC